MPRWLPPPSGLHPTSDNYGYFGTKPQLNEHRDRWSLVNLLAVGGEWPHPMLIVLLLSSCASKLVAPVSSDVLRNDSTRCTQPSAKRFMKFLAFRYSSFP